ncbi:hypothetical protein CYMTET_16293 [Cymbomonas tetramitiformis]|uniref:C2 domain-containing protein n=1 Tax=Cymbomonas tetramitiformis TaxID=36881 RepID=A0AAE0GDR3_9CHLO|nr:hypothetical protein CYMTET_16293 [Cymbomonas tetramitiformis]
MGAALPHRSPILEYAPYWSLNLLELLRCGIGASAPDAGRCSHEVGLGSQHCPRDPVTFPVPRRVSTTLDVSTSCLAVVLAFSQISPWATIVTTVRQQVDMMQASRAAEAPAMDDLDADDESSLPGQGRPAVPGTLQIPTKLSIKVGMSLNVALEDDRMGVSNEVLQLGLQQVDVDVNMDKNQRGAVDNTSAMLKLLLSLKYLDSAVDLMEPVMEPWKLSAEYKEIGVSRSVLFSSTQRMDVHLSPMLLRSVGDLRCFVQTMQQAAASGNAASHVARASSIMSQSSLLPSKKHNGAKCKSWRTSYHIHNLTGMRLTYWTDSTDGDRHTYTMNAGDKTPLYVEPTFKVVAMPDQGEMEAHTISMQLEGNWTPLKDILVDKVGKYVQEMRSPFDKSTMSVVLEVTLVARTKILSVHSLLRICNSTMRPLQFLLRHSGNLKHGGSQKGGRELTLGPLDAGDHLFVPLNVGERAFLVLQAEGYMRADKDKIGLNMKQLLEQQGLISCPSVEDPDAPPFVCSLKAQEVLTQSRGCAVPVKEYVLTVSPPLLVENLLPYTMQVTIEDRETRVQKVYAIQPGEKRPVHDLTMEHRLKMEVTLDVYPTEDSEPVLYKSHGLVPVHYPPHRLHPALSGLVDYQYQYAEASFLNDLPGMRLPREILMMNSATKRIGFKISIENTMHAASHTRHMSLYCPYWLVNHTKVRLQMRDSSTMAPIDCPEALPDTQAMPILYNTSRSSMQIQIWGEKDSWSKSMPLNSVGIKGAVSMMATKEPVREDSSVRNSLTLARQASFKDLQVPDPPGMARGSKCDAVDHCASTASSALDTPYDRRRKAGPTFASVKEGRRQYEFGVEVRLAPGAFSRTKVVTLSPRFLIKNESGQPCWYAQRGCYDTARLLQAGSHSSFHWADHTKRFEIQVKPGIDVAYQWSGSFRIDEAGEIGVRVRGQEAAAGAEAGPSRQRATYLIMPVDVSLSGASVVVTLGPADSPPPYRIENQCANLELQVWQAGTDPLLATRVLPKQSIPYAWDEPASASHRLKVEIVGYKITREYSLDDITRHPPLMLSRNSAGAGSPPSDGGLLTMVTQGFSTVASAASSAINTGLAVVPGLHTSDDQWRTNVLQNGNVRKVHVNVLASGETRVLTFSDTVDRNDDDPETVALKLQRVELSLKEVDAQLRSLMEVTPISPQPMAPGGPQARTPGHHRSTSNPLALDILPSPEMPSPQGRGLVSPGPKGHEGMTKSAKKKKLMGFKSTNSKDKEKEKEEGRRDSALLRSLSDTEQLAGRAREKDKPYRTPIRFKRQGSNGKRLQKEKPSKSLGSLEYLDPTDIGNPMPVMTSTVSERAESVSLVSSRVNSRVSSAESSALPDIDVEESIEGGELVVRVVSAAGIGEFLGRQVDSYVVATCEGVCFRSRVVRRTSNPVYDEEIVFKSVRTSSDLYISLHEPNQIGADQFLGEVYIPLDELPENEPCQKWYTLGRRSARDTVSGTVQLAMSWNVTRIERMTLKLKIKVQELDNKEELLAMLQQEIDPSHNSLDSFLVAARCTSGRTKTSPSPRLSSTSPSSPAAPYIPPPQALEDLDLGSRLRHMPSSMHERTGRIRSGNISPRESRHLSSPRFAGSPTGPRTPRRQSIHGVPINSDSSSDNNPMNNVSFRKELFQLKAGRSESAKAPALNEQSVGTFTVKVLRAENLSLPSEPNDMLRGFYTCDSYARISCSEVSGNMQVHTPCQTKVAANTLSPIWNEEFTFKSITLGSSLTIQVFDHKTLGPDQPLGEVAIPCELFSMQKPKYCRVSLFKKGGANDANDTKVSGEVHLRVRWKHDLLVSDEGNTTSVEISLTGFGFSIIEAYSDRLPRELMHVLVEGVKVDMRATAHEQTLHLSVVRVQVDNQLLTAHTPVVLAPTSTGLRLRDPKDQEEEKPLMNFTIAKVVHNPSIVYIRYMSVLLQEIDLEVEEEFVDLVARCVARLPLEDMMQDVAYARCVELADFGKHESDMKDVQGMLQNIYRVPGVVNVEGGIGQSRGRRSKWYFDILQIQPIKVNVTMTLDAGTRNPESPGWHVHRFTSAMGYPLINLNNVPLKVNSLALKNAFLSHDALMNQIARHFFFQALHEIYKILGSVEFLGTPVTLLSNLGTGVVDFFYEPAKGFVHSPEDFARGIAAGTISLLKNSVFGVFNTVGTVTGSFGKGLAVLSMDQDYIQRLHRRPASSQDTFVQGAQNLTWGIYEGVTGLVTNPIAGAEKEGVVGFMKGLVTGAAGVVIKPTAGVLEFASKTVSGLGGGIRYLGDDYVRVPRTRIRAPRNFIGNNTVSTKKEYTVWNQALQRISKGEYKQDRVVDFLPNKANKMLLVTNKRLLYINVRKMRVRWAITFDRISNIDAIERQLLVVIDSWEDCKYGPNLRCCIGRCPGRYWLRCPTRDLHQALLVKLNHALQDEGTDRDGGNRNRSGSRADGIRDIKMKIETRRMRSPSGEDAQEAAARTRRSTLMDWLRDKKRSSRKSFRRSADRNSEDQNSEDPMADSESSPERPDSNDPWEKPVASGSSREPNTARGLKTMRRRHGKLLQEAITFADVATSGEIVPADPGPLPNALTTLQRRPMESEVDVGQSSGESTGSRLVQLVSVAQTMQLLSANLAKARGGNQSEEESMRTIRFMARSAHEQLIVLSLASRDDMISLLLSLENLCTDGLSGTLSTDKQESLLSSLDALCVLLLETLQRAFVE